MDAGKREEKEEKSKGGKEEHKDAKRRGRMKKNRQMETKKIQRVTHIDGSKQQQQQLQQRWSHKVQKHN